MNLALKTSKKVMKTCIFTLDFHIPDSFAFAKHRKYFKGELSKETWSNSNKDKGGNAEAHTTGWIIINFNTIETGPSPLLTDIALQYQR